MRPSGSAAMVTAATLQKISPLSSASFRWHRGVSAPPSSNGCVHAPISAAEPLTSGACGLATRWGVPADTGPTATSDTASEAATMTPRRGLTMRPSPSMWCSWSRIVALGAWDCQGPSVLVLLVGRRGAATLRHRLAPHGPVLLVGRVDLHVVPGGPIDQGLDLGRVGVDALGVDVEVDRDRPGHALF